MEQRNEMLQRMRMTEKQKRGDVQHLLARSFSSRQMSIPAIPPTPSSPPGEISIPVPQLRRVHFDHPPHPSTAAALALSDVTVETNKGNLIPMTTIREEVGVVEGQCGALCTGSENGLNCMVVNSVFSGKGVNSGVCYLRWREWCTPGVVATETSS